MSLNPKLMFMAMIILGVILEVGGDFFFKKWSINGKLSILILGLTVYFAGAYFWAVSLKYEGLSLAAAVFTMLNLIAAALLGVFYFKENLTILHKIGVALGILSIIFIES